jgi:Tol biopolymer transport system component
MKGGEARRLTSQTYAVCRAPAWTPDGGEILFWVRGEGIRRVSVAGGDPEPILGVGVNARMPSLQGSRMVYQQATAQPLDIWRMPGPRGSNRDRAPERLIASSTEDSNMDYSPDGRRIAFNSARGGGASNIWICDSDGANPVQLTRFERGGGTARWSPDSRRIVFDSGQAGDMNLYVIDADGGVPRRLTPQPSWDVMGTWSRDGRWIYFLSDRTGTSQIWKIPAEGGEAVQVTTGGGGYAEESWDGGDLYYTRFGPTGIWRAPVGGGEETQVLAESELIGRSPSVSRSGLYYLRQLAGADMSSTQGRRSGYGIDFFDFESGQVTKLFEDGDFAPGDDLAVSPDEEWILMARSPLRVSEIMLMENFR